MANKVRDSRHIVFDGERHLTGDMCWCEPEYNELTNFFLHPMRFEKGKNVSTEDREFTA